MIVRLLRFALSQRIIVVLACLGLIGAGIWSFEQLKIEAYPDVADTQVVVITTFPGRAAEEVEQQVTIPIERALNSTPGVIARRSRTIFGLSVVELTFQNDTNDYFARQVVLERLRDATLPDNVNPDLGPMATPIGELYRYSVRGPGKGEIELRELQDWVIAPRFLQVPGVADVTPFGGLVKQYQVDLDPAALAKYSLTIGQVSQAIGANNGNAGGAMLDNQQQAMVVRGVGLIRNAEDIGKIVLTSPKGVPIFVRDVGAVKIGALPPSGVFGVSETQGGVEGIVLMRRGENPSEVLKGIKAVADELNASRLPSGVRIEPIYDRTDLVENTVHTVSHTLIEGLVIVVTMLLLFLGSWRAAVLTALTIPLSMLFAFVCMHFTGIPANLLSLGALDFGVIVDGTLVMVEHIVRTLEERKNDTRHAVKHLIGNAALEVESPIFYSLIIIISAYIPLFTLERVERRLFTPMAYTICFALLGSMILALSLVPVLATFLFRNGAKTWQNPFLRWTQDAYGRALELTLRYPWRTVAVGAAIVAGAFGLATRLGTEFLPQLDEGTLWVRANLPAGISLSQSATVARTIRSVIQSYPEVLLVSSQSGRNDGGTDPYGPNRNEFFVALRPYSEWAKGKTKSHLVRELSARLAATIPSANFSFTQPIIDNVTEAVTGSPADLAVIFRGPDLQALRVLGQSALRELRTIPGAADTFIEQEEDQAQLRITMDRDAIARYGLNVSDVAGVIEMAIGGKTTSTMFQGERRFDISIRYKADARKDAASIGNIMIQASNGNVVPLSQLAEIKVVNGASIIARRDNERILSVRTNIRGRDQGGFVEEAQRRLQSTVPLPAGYSVSWGGQFENLERASRRLRIILPVTILVIFTILFFAFQSVGNAALVLVNVPFSLVGGILLLWVREIHLSVSAAVGFISLFGVAVMSGLLYLAEIQRRRKEEGTPLEEAIIGGAKSQLRPRLILILVALMGMVPAAMATGVGSDVQRPLATVVVGGLFSTLFLTLLVLPSLYYLANRNSPPPAKRALRHSEAKEQPSAEPEPELTVVRRAEIAFDPEGA
ncbi:MAG: CusA/CzcA family heavy metal efflux RND transporter [Bryobacteraceae bacterium]